MTAVNDYLEISGAPCLSPSHLSSEARRLNYDDSKWRNRANSITLSGGIRPSSAFVLVSKEVFDSLNVDQSHTLSAFCMARSASEADTKFSGVRRMVFPNMYIYRAEAVLAGAEDVKGPYLLELRDQRQIWAMSYIFGSYNLICHNETNYFASSTNGGSAWTWNTMLTDIIDDLPLSAAISLAEASFPTANPETFRFFGMSGMDAIGYILRDIGHLFLPSITGGTFAARIARPDYLSAPNAKLKMAPVDLSYCPEITAARIPAKIAVMFPDRDYGYQGYSDDRVVDPHDVVAALPMYVLQVNTNKGVTGTTIAVHDSMYVTRDVITRAITNSAALITRANEVASRLVSRLSGEDRQNVYSGLIPFELDSDIGSVTWIDYGGGWKTIAEMGPAVLSRVHNYHDFPDIVDYHVPVHRKCVAIVTTGEVAVGGTGNAKVQYLSGTSWVDVSPQKNVSFRNVGNASIVAGNRVYLEWWWQSKEWIAFCGFET